MINTLVRFGIRVVLLMVLLTMIALVLRFTLFDGPVRPTDALPESAIVDTHVHIAGLGYGDSGAFVSKHLEDSYKFDIYLGAFGVSREDLKEHGDQIIVSRMAETIEASTKVRGAIVLAMDGVINQNGELDQDNTQIYLPNDYVARETASGTSHPVCRRAGEYVDQPGTASV